LSLLDNNELLASFDIGEAVESFDYHTVVARSIDCGSSWTLEGPLLREVPPSTTHSVRTSRRADGSVIGFGGFYRRTPEADLVNRQTFGLVPVDLFTVGSNDGGRTWTTPKMIEAPLIGPSWEICHSIVDIGNGRWLAPTSTWRGWDGKDYPGDRAVVLISDDQGKSWSKFGTTFDGRKTELSYLEQSVIGLNVEVVLAVAWVYDIDSGSTRPSVYAISRDGGETFTEPQVTGFESQTCKVLRLFDGRLLCVHRSNDRVGLWATLASLENDSWINLAEAPLWQDAGSGMKGKGNSADELSDLKFGHPTLRQIADNEVLILFWCQEQCLTNIRWIKLRLE